MTEHIPGPWFLSSIRHVTEGDRSHSLAIIDACGTPRRHVLCIEGPDEDDVRTKASLVAAAPDMLAMLERCRSDLYERGFDTVDPEKLDALIAKARGVSS